MNGLNIPELLHEWCNIRHKAKKLAKEGTLFTQKHNAST